MKKKILANKSKYEMKSINQVQDEIIEDFSMFDDWMDKYANLIEMGNELSDIDPKYKVDNYLLEGNRVFDGNATDTGFTENDGDLIGTFRDTDGTVYKAGAQIVKDILFHSTPNCVQRTNWKMMACEETFGQVSIYY